jgi:hypothetical protein
MFLTPFRLYADAYAAARKAASESGADYGIEKTNEYGRNVFRVFRLPGERFRQGFELRCEVVTPQALP